jgi:hypothetical protein
MIPDGTAGAEWTRRAVARDACRTLVVTRRWGAPHLNSGYSTANVREASMLANGAGAPQRAAAFVWLRASWARCQTLAADDERVCRFRPLLPDGSDSKLARLITGAAPGLLERSHVAVAELEQLRVDAERHPRIGVSEQGVGAARVDATDAQDRRERPVFAIKLRRLCDGTRVRYVAIDAPPIRVRQHSPNPRCLPNPSTAARSKNPGPSRPPRCPRPWPALCRSGASAPGTRA